MNSIDRQLATAYIEDVVKKDQEEEKNPLIERSIEGIKTSLSSQVVLDEDWKKVLAGIAGGGLVGALAATANAVKKAKTEKQRLIKLKVLVKMLDEKGNLTPEQKQARTIAQSWIDKFEDPRYQRGARIDRTVKTVGAALSGAALGGMAGAGKSNRFSGFWEEVELEECLDVEESAKARLKNAATLAAIGAAGGAADHAGAWLHRKSREAEMKGLKRKMEKNKAKGKAKRNKVLKAKLNYLKGDKKQDAWMGRKGGKKNLAKRMALGAATGAALGALDKSEKPKAPPTTKLKYNKKTNQWE